MDIEDAREVDKVLTACPHFFDVEICFVADRSRTSNAVKLPIPHQWPFFAKRRARNPFRGKTTTYLSARYLAYPVWILLDILLAPTTRVATTDKFRVLLEARWDRLRSVRVAFNELDHLLLLLAAAPGLKRVHRREYKRVTVVRVT